MAANYWLSTQCNHWLLDRTQLDLARKEDFLYATHQELAAIQIWISSQVIYLCKRLALRQRVVATACVFLRRFFAKNSYCAVDPLLTIAAAVYVAAKVEESPVHIKSICAEATRHFEQMGSRSFHADISGVAEMEFYLLEELEFDLIVYHPYRSLVAIYDQVGAGALQGRSKEGGLARSGDPSSPSASKTDKGIGLGLSASSSLRGDAEVDAGLFPLDAHDTAPRLGIQELDETTIQLAWFVINNSYTTDLPLMHPPHLVAIAAIWMAILLDPASRSKITDSAHETQRQRDSWRQEVREMIEGSPAPAPASARADGGKAGGGPTTTAQAGKTTATPSQTATPSSIVSTEDDASSMAGKGIVAASPSSLPEPRRPPSNETLTWLASLNVSVPTVAAIVQELVKTLDREAQVKELSQDGQEVLRRLERMREMRRKRLLRERANTNAT